MNQINGVKTQPRKITTVKNEKSKRKELIPSFRAPQPLL
jgi:hypothetical protein